MFFPKTSESLWLFFTQKNPPIWNLHGLQELKSIHPQRAAVECGNHRTIGNHILRSVPISVNLVPMISLLYLTIFMYIIMCIYICQNLFSELPVTSVLSSSRHLLSFLSTFPLSMLKSVNSRNPSKFPPFWCCFAVVLSWQVVEFTWIYNNFTKCIFKKILTEGVIGLMIICLGKIPSNYILGPGGHKGVSLKVQATGSALSSSARAHSQSPALPEGYNNGLREPLTHQRGTPPRESYVSADVSVCCRYVCKYNMTYIYMYIYIYIYIHTYLHIIICISIH